VVRGRRIRVVSQFESVVGLKSLDSNSAQPFSRLAFLCWPEQLAARWAARAVAACVDGVAALYCSAALLAVQAPRPLAENGFGRAGAVLGLTVLLTLHGIFLSVVQSRPRTRPAIRLRSFRDHER
jgi:hypothetical protein